MPIPRAIRLQAAALWYAGPPEGVAAIERASTGNLKATWTRDGRTLDWFDDRTAQGREYLRGATQVKTGWVPYGE